MQKLVFTLGFVVECRLFWKNWAYVWFWPIHDCRRPTQSCLSFRNHDDLCGRVEIVNLGHRFYTQYLGVKALG